MIYSITAISFFLVSIYLWRENSPKKTRLALILAMLWLILHDGLRWEIGTDWENYYDFFYEQGSNFSNLHMGFVYGYFNELSRSLVNSFSFLLVCIATFTYIVIGRLFYKYSPNPLISVCIYYCSMMGIMGSNRQLLAIVVCVISLKFVLERRKLYFFLLVLFASSIHITALSFLPAYYLYNYNISNKKVLLFVVVAFLVGISRLINKLPFVEYLTMLDNLTSNTSTASYFSEEKIAGVSIVGSFKRLLYVYLAIYVRKYIKDENYDYFFKLFVFGCCIYLVFNGSYLQLMAGRGAAYYSVYESVVFSFVIIRFPIKFIQKELLWLVLFVIYFLLMWRDMNSYFILDGVDIYNPYKSVVFM